MQDGRSTLAAPKYPDGHNRVPVRHSKTRCTVDNAGPGPHPGQGSVEHRLAAHAQTSPGPTHDDRVELAPQPVAATSRSSPCITGSHPSWGTFTCAGSLGQREARTNPPTIVKPRTPWRAQRHPDQTRTPLRAGHDNGPTFSQPVSTFLTRARTAPGHSPEPPSRFVAARTVDASELHRTRQTRFVRSRCLAPAADPSQSADPQIETVPCCISPSTRLASHGPRRRLTEEDDHGRRALAVTRDRPRPPTPRRSAHVNRSWERGRT